MDFSYKKDAGGFFTTSDGQRIDLLFGVKNKDLLEKWSIEVREQRNQLIKQLKKKYKKELLKSLKHLEAAESAYLRVMTNLMLLKEMKENNIKFKKGDVFSFEDDIFDYSEDKNVRILAKLRKKTLKAMHKLVENNQFKDKELKFLA